MKWEFENDGIVDLAGEKELMIKPLPTTVSAIFVLGIWHSSILRISCPLLARAPLDAAVAALCFGHSHEPYRLSG